MQEIRKKENFNQDQETQQTDCFVPRNDELQEVSSLRGGTTKQSVSLLPKLRFDEFDDDWDKKKMIDLSERIGDGLHGTPKYEDNSEISFINGNNLIDGKVFITAKTKKVDKTTFLKNDKKLKTNTILISLNGTIGNIARYNNEKVMLGKSVGYFNFKENSNYYYHVLKSPKIQRFFISELTGSTIKNLSLKTLRETNIPFPSVKEQQKIASFLTSVDTKIQQLTTKKQYLENYKKGVMQQLFSQQLRFKNDDGTDFPDWEEKKLEEFISNFIVPMRDKPKDLNGEIPWCRIEDFDGKYLSKSKSNQGVSIETIKEMNLKVYPVNTLLVSCSANLGFCAIVKKELITNQTFIGLVPDNEKIDIDYLYHIMKLSSRKLNVLSSGTTISYLSRKQFENFKIDYPNIKEQQKIANYLSAIDKKITNVQTQIDKTQTFKKGLLQQMFI
jgi:type I restriction enzyme S subunit